MKASCTGFYIFFLLQKGVLSLSCGISDFSEILKETEHSIINISYSVNVTEGLEFTDKFNAVYEVCERNSIKTCCTFIWNKGFNNMMGTDVSQKTGVLCTGKQQTSSNSVVTLELQISQLVSRSLSVMKLSTSRSGSLKITRNIGVEVSYPPM
ncbi:uncharacterized protein LOC112569215 [Pomacea canaliculata]|uniref:uncharacterized protein LOC112569215 n=1 Tax=Pomacea canaliculata TaxID=400727 RepID=UPI000D7283A1|nr:uncharacterized protein LOC112569215 [Pomacea canaliculata]